MHGDTIYVPTNYTAIQDAINNASSGDVIIVGDNIYYENLVINKSITLKSEVGRKIVLLMGISLGM